MPPKNEKNDELIAQMRELVQSLVTSQLNTIKDQIVAAAALQTIAPIKLRIPSLPRLSKHPLMAPNPWNGFLKPSSFLSFTIPLMLNVSKWWPSICRGMHWGGLNGCTPTNNCPLGMLSFETWNCALGPPLLQIMRRHYLSSNKLDLSPISSCNLRRFPTV